jgi:hypothetical protein
LEEAVDLSSDRLLMMMQQPNESQGSLIHKVSKLHTFNYIIILFTALNLMLNTSVNRLCT